MKRVRATALGFAPGSEFKRIRPGEILDVPDDFDAPWFEVLSQDAPKAKPKKSEQTTLSELARAPVKTGTDLA